VPASTSTDAVHKTGWRSRCRKWDNNMSLQSFWIIQDRRVGTDLALQTPFEKLLESEFERVLDQHAVGSAA
jgi:hypothetical protein